MTHFHNLDSNTKQKDVLGLVCDPIATVRIGFIGLGKRGKEAFINFMYIDGVEVCCLCDILEENVNQVRMILAQHNRKEATIYTDIDGWRSVCERADIDLVYICTDRSLHTTIAIYAMQMGKHVAVEVPAANTLEECWQLVDTAERFQRHCLMLENCCYDSFHLTVLNMIQKELLGEVFHAEGGYIHDLRKLDFDRKPHYLNVWLMVGNPYPTHGLGPLCQLLNIHRGDMLESLVSVSSGQFGFPDYNESDFQKKCVLGNMNTTIIRTKKQKTIVLQHDISSPRPYSRNYLISGTKGFVKKQELPQMSFLSNSNDLLSEIEMNDLFTKYEHPFYQSNGNLAREVDVHGGMNFIMNYRLIYCLQQGLALDMDVYDAAVWSSIIELSAESVNNGSIPIIIPDFTKGAWCKSDTKK